MKHQFLSVKERVRKRGRERRGREQKGGCENLFHYRKSPPIWGQITSPYKEDHLWLRLCFLVMNMAMIWIRHVTVMVYGSQGIKRSVNAGYV